ncbi:methyltransferase family protein [Congregibacter litoralis]|uniref:Isoprenylcysteine carboxylmethyltransferase family protein n=1 Tax=Congregibacter litoralis KT71 TaxID=314285 RepID=A4ACA2_9GAMM|nr:methyltransferase [Congregibacter litoralis]EAQ96330.1 putative protein-S-isoprenylcysteine methyltransferase [Congregibacter litoralis KT71]
MKLKTPPLAYLLACALIGYVAAESIPQLAYHSSSLGVFGWALIAFGGFCLAASVVAFIRAKTTVNPMSPSEANRLVQTGLYRYSRNPMYLAMAAVLVGVAFLLQNVAAFTSPLLFVLAINYLQIIPEEQELARRFGKDFETYRRSTARWI